MIDRPRKGTVWSRWDKRKKRIELLTDDEVSHYLTIKEAYQLFMGLLHVMPHSEVAGLLRHYE